MTDAIADHAFRSILWPDGGDTQPPDGVVAEPDCFHDLNLDQVVAAIDGAWPEENLAPIFHVPLATAGAVTWRQEVLRDLEHAPLRQAVAGFVERLRDMRTRLAHIEKLFYPVEKQRSRLGASDVYCTAVWELDDALARLQPGSTGLRQLHAWLSAYVASAAFDRLRTDTANVLAGLEAIRYNLLVRSGSVTVRPCAEEADASTAVEATFARFRPDGGGATPPRAQGRIGFNGLNHIEAQVLDKVAILHPAPFAMLATFCDEHDTFIDPLLDRFAHEVCFFLAWLAYIAPIRDAGLQFCFPVVERDSPVETATDSFDVALAARQVGQHATVVRNGFALRDGERMLIVTGPNHGGKTTFARMFGQLHWLVALGLTVPGTQVQLQLFDRLFTHFERAERIESMRGKLQDDLVRMRAILHAATPRSLVVINEIFASTTLDDALALARRVLARLAQLRSAVVCVTFLTELADFDSHTVSMVAEVDPHDPAIRTFRVVRRPADGLAYALAVANKHRVTRDWLLRRIAP